MPEHTARSEQDEPWATFTVITAQCNVCGGFFSGREMTPHAKTHASGV